jgi:hypothetical protein
VKRDRLNLQGGMTVETYLDGTGRIYIAYARGASVFLQDVKALRQFLKLPPKTDSRLALDSWLESLADMDAQKEAPKPAEVNLQQTWGPEAHADEGDPTANTKMIT